MFFVNLPLSYIAADRKYLDFFIENGLNPELGADVSALQYQDDAWFEKTAEAFKSAGIKSSIHLPFQDLAPGSQDDFIWEACKKRLLQAMERVEVFEPVHYVGHPQYSPLAPPEYREEWLDRSVRVWSEFIEKRPSDAPLYLENTFDDYPEPLAELLVELTGRFGKDAVGICFDVGHWFCFSKGKERKNLAQWLDVLGPFMRHLHLHDNDGSSDQHMGMGKGNIPWEEFFHGAAERGIRPGVTLEPFDEGPLKDSIDFMNAHSSFFA